MPNTHIGFKLDMRFENTNIYDIHMYIYTWRYHNDCNSTNTNHELREERFNLLRPGDGYVSHGNRSILVRVMAYCPTAPSHAMIRTTFVGRIQFEWFYVAFICCSYFIALFGFRVITGTVVRLKLSWRLPGNSVPSNHNCTQITWIMNNNILSVYTYISLGHF